MRKECSKYSFIFIVLMMIIVITPNVTYGDPEVPQSSEVPPSKWAKAGIDKAISANLLPENLQGDYKDNITRAEFSEIAVNLYEALSGKEGIVPEENPFSDTEDANIRIANSLGVVKGVGDGQFAPDDAITRQEISVMLYRTLKAAKPEYNYSSSYKYEFADDDMISKWAQQAVDYLYGIGVVNGVGDNQFEPKSDTSREEAIIFAVRMYEKVSASKGNLVVSRGETSRRETVMKAKLATYISEEMGKPYQWGAEGPNSYDCSGLVYYLYGKLDISMPRVSRSQAEVGTYVSKQDLEYGDLVFFARDGRNINHVGIYVEDGMFVHAPESGDVVKKTTLMSGYYERSYHTARRIIK